MKGSKNTAINKIANSNLLHYSTTSMLGKVLLFSLEMMVEIHIFHILCYMNILLTVISPLNKRGQEVGLKCQTVKFIAHEVEGHPRTLYVLHCRVQC